MKRQKGCPESEPWEPVGDDLDVAIDSQNRKQAYFEALDANVPVIKELEESGRTKITDAVFRWFAELQLFQGKDQQGKSEKKTAGVQLPSRIFPITNLDLLGSRSRGQKVDVPERKITAK